MIFEALMNFNPRTVFVGEKRDGMALSNHANKALFVGPIE
jgi:hypothetical protein